MGRTIIVTGGANGMGRCITEHFASEGETVYILDKEARQTVLVANEMQHKGWNVIGYIGDIADKQTLIDFAGQVLYVQRVGVETHTHQQAAFVPSNENDYLQHPSQRVDNSNDIARGGRFPV